MPKKISILITALGGEGGGTLMTWILDCARKHDLFVQGTSVPGVAQRTGSTSYYIEICESNYEVGKEPVLSMYPIAGMVDLVVSSELLETARVMERGFVHPDRTTLVSSNSRKLTNTEKSDLYDGMFASNKIIETGTKMSKNSIFLDLQNIAEKASTIISSPMFGAIAATKILPWEKEISESVFDANEFGKNSLEGFRLAFDKISNKNVILENKGIDKESNKADKISISIDVPESLKKIIYLSMERCKEYQNMEYANLFLNRICELINKIDQKNKNSLSIIENSARRLCLWMVYEDISRVAQLKISKNRVEKIKKEVNLKNDQLLIVKDYFKPGVDEIIAIMPNRLGKWLSNNKKLFKLFPFVGKGIKINVLSISGYILMRILSSIRKIRPYSYRYIQESKEIDLWLEAMKYSLEKSTKFADQLSNLPHLLKGYGDTWIRGKEKYSKVFNTLVSPLISKNILEQDVENLKEAISIAMNTLEIDKLDRFLLTRK